jgi:lantibiotic modifying enzyme
LLQAQSVVPNGLRAWKTIRDQYLTGLSHGAAGIGYALAGLYEWTGDSRFHAATLDAQIYETSLFSEKERNWPNLLLPLKDGGYDFWNSWCHGAPGIGLGRLGSMPSCQTDTTAVDIEHALAKAGQMELTNLDIACCGNMGRVELLIEASTRLNKPEHLQRAKAIGSAIVERAREQGRYSAGVKDGIVIPTFHQGLAGIGYQLLRMADPATVPSVLTWS